MQVLGDRRRGEAADLVEGGAAEHRAAPAEERRVPVILAALDHPEEQRLLGPDHAPLARAAVLVGVEVVEVLRRLHERDVRVLQVADGLGQELARRRVIRVEHGEELRGREQQRVVEVARLGVGVDAAGDVPATELGGELAHLRAIAVVEQPGLVRMVHVACGEQRPPDHLDRLVEGGDEDVDRAPRARRWRRPHGQPPAHEEMQRRRPEAEHLRRVDGDRERHRIRVERVEPPHEVDGGDGQECHDERRPRDAQALGLEARRGLAEDRRGRLERRQVGVGRHRETQSAADSRARRRSARARASHFFIRRTPLRASAPLASASSRGRGWTARVEEVLWLFWPRGFSGSADALSTIAARNAGA